MSELGILYPELFAKDIIVSHAGKPGLRDGGGRRNLEMQNAIERVAQDEDSDDEMAYLVENKWLEMKAQIRRTITDNGTK